MFLNKEKKNLVGDVVDQKDPREDISDLLLKIMLIEIRNFE